MQLNEILVQINPGKQGLLRFSVQSGFNGWRQKGTYSLGHLSNVILELLYPGAEAKPLGPGQARRAGIVFQSKGETYRLVKDFERRQIHLSQLESGTKDQFRDVSKDPRFIAEALKRSAKLPPKRFFKKVLISKFRSYLAEGDIASFSTTPSLPEEEGALTVNPQERLTDLRREKATMERLAHLEESQHEIQDRIFKIEDSLRTLEGPQESMEEIDQNLSRFKVLDALGDVDQKLRDRLKSFPTADETREKELQALEEQRSETEAELVSLPDIPEWKEPTLIVGVVLTLLGFILSYVFSSLLMVFLPLFAIGLGLCFYGYLRGIKRLERRSVLAKKLEDVDKERAGIEKRFEIETNPVRELFEKVGMDDSEEILEYLEERDRLLTRREAAEKKLGDLQAEIGEDSLLSEKRDLEAQYEKIQGELAEIPPASMDPMKLEKELLQLEKAVASGDSQPRSKITDADDDPNQLLGLVSEALGQDHAMLLQKVHGAMSRNLQTMSDGQIKDFIEKNGKIEGYVNSSGQAVPWAQSEPEMRTLILFSVQFTFWQVLANTLDSFFFLDLTEVPEPMKGPAKKALSAAQFVARQSQVIVLSV